MTEPLCSIEEEAAVCRTAFAGVPIGTMVWHCHHWKLMEPLTEPAESWIEYILNLEPAGEQALRLRLFRPVVGPMPPEVEEARAKLVKADAECVKARVEWGSVDAECVKARVEWGSVDAECVKARVEWGSVDAKWEKARAKWAKAFAELENARAKWEKADVELEKADVELEKARVEWGNRVHAEECRDCPWDGWTIFS